MTMKLRTCTTAALLALCLAQPLSADRYAVQFGFLPPSYVPDSTDMSLHFDAATAGFQAPTLANPVPLAIPAAPAIAAVTVPADPNPALARVTTGQPTALLNMPETLADLVPAPSGPPSAEFIAALNRVYSSSVQAEVDAVWGKFQSEPDSLPIDQRVGNAVVKFIIQLGRSPGSDSSARPDLLKPNATRGTVRSANGLGVRSSPWGPPGGAALGSGATVEIVPPAEGPWYQVRSGSGTGWVAGLWLDLQ